MARSPQSLAAGKRRWFQSIRVLILLAFTAMVIVIGFAEMLAYNQVSRLKSDELKDDFRELQHQATALVKSGKEFMCMGRNQISFFQTDSSKSLVDYDSALVGFRSASLQTRKALLADGHQQLGELDAIDRHVDSLDTLFSTYVALVKQRGIGDYGLVGEFASSLMFISQFNFEADNQVLFDMQLSTLNYQLTGEMYVLDQSQSDLQQFRRVSGKYLAEGEQAMVESVLTEYESTLYKLVEMDAELGIFSGAGMQGDLFGRMQKIEDGVTMGGIQDKIDAIYTDIVERVLLDLVVILVITIAVSGLILLLLFRKLVRPINHLREIIHSISRGKLPSSLPQYRTTEVRHIAESVEVLTDGLRETSDFAQQIGEGQFETEFTPMSEEDQLGNSLLQMRENLRKLSEEEEKRNWGNEGYAQFMEVLRTHNQDIGQLSTKLLSDLVNFLGASQAALFVLDEQGEAPCLELKGCYAWGRNKHLKKRIGKGEGVVGQAWQEGERIFLTDVPDNFMEISSGLGKANPTCVLVLPLSFNETIYGVLELAAFQVFEPHQMDLLDRLAESIASTLSNARVNETTSGLLEELKLTSEAQQAQEEELRQNMEEMMASQEEAQRREQEYLAEIERLKEQLSEPVESATT